MQTNGKSDEISIDLNKFTIQLSMESKSIKRRLKFVFIFLLMTSRNTKDKFYRKEFGLHELHKIVKLLSQTDRLKDRQIDQLMNRRSTERKV